MGQIQLSPEIQNKIIEEWNKIAKKYGDVPPEERKIAWVEFSGKIEKEYGLTAWQVWELVRGKKTNNRETSKWYKKSIYVVTERNFISVLLFLSSVVFYFIQKVSEGQIAKFISIYSFFLGIGENIGDKIGEKYSSKNISRFFLLFVAITCIIFLSIKDIIKSAEFIQAVLVGIGLGTFMGFELKKLRLKNLID